MKLPQMNKAQKRLIWVILVFDFLAFVLAFISHLDAISKCGQTTKALKERYCDDYSGWVWLFLIVGIVLLFWLLGQKKPQD